MREVACRYAKLVDCGGFERQFDHVVIPQSGVLLSPCWVIVMSGRVDLRPFDSEFGSGLRQRLATLESVTAMDDLLDRFSVTENETRCFITSLSAKSQTDLI